MSWRRMTLLSVAVVAVAGVVASQAVTVSAQSGEFIASKSGKVTGKAVNTQIFKTGAGTIECTGATSSGTVTEGKATIHKEVVTYSGCTGFGKSISITAAHFELNAGGSEKLEKAVDITLEGASCEVVIPSQTMEGMDYKNEAGGKVVAGADIFDIKSKGTGGVCGSENSEGSYTGSIEAELEGGTLEWK